ncbi:MAG: tetratricopeptide repeat protein [Proteobacteria bacterium]|nr:tetratricopeptide repeat protein [Pseudomonadota bacterium]
MRSTHSIAVLLTVAMIGEAAGDAKTEADRLFDEGVALREQGKLPEACAKFAAAMKKDERAIGTLLNLALCAEKDGRTATAVKLFTEARDRAGEQDLQAQQTAAAEHLATLGPLVPHLTIKLARPLPGMKILVDDQVVAPDALVGLSLDPGARTINVSAPGRLPFATTVTLQPSSAQTIDVPELATVVVVKSSKRTIGKIATIGGAVVLGTSVGLAMYAKRTWDTQFEAHVDAGGNSYVPCHGDVCDAGGQQGTERARTFGTLATVVGGVGLAAIGVGVYFWLTAPASSPETEPRHAWLVPVVAPDHVGFATTLRW